MSDQTLGKARGLNSIADPRAFKGTSGRNRPGDTPSPPAPAADPATTPAPEIRELREPPARMSAPPAPATAPIPKYLERPRPPVPMPSEPAPAEPVGAVPHRAVVPGLNRKRRELSVPTILAEAVERTGINPADVVMAGYRKHADTIYAGHGGRMMARGRTRLRLSISDTEFDQLTRLGQARGWNRSETVSVILAMELLAPSPAVPQST